MELEPKTDDDIIRANYGNGQLTGVIRFEEGLFFSLEYTPEAVAAMRPIVTPRTAFGSLPRPLLPISAALAEELGLDN